MIPARPPENVQNASPFETIYVAINPPESDRRKLNVIAPNVVGAKYMFVPVQVVPTIFPSITSGDINGTLQAA
jgi:hypothetical protein